MSPLSSRFDAELQDTLGPFFDAYTLAYNRRYGIKPTILPESVATHCFFVSLCVLQLHEVFDFDIGVALAMSVCHDLPEAELSDIPNVVKKRFPRIADAFEDAEQVVVNRWPPHMRAYFNMYTMHDTTEAHIVKLADSLQCTQYAISETLLGNTNFDDVLAQSLNRAERMVDVLAPKRRNNVDDEIPF